jgi:hypothetical protein
MKTHLEKEMSMPQMTLETIQEMNELISEIISTIERTPNDQVLGERIRSKYLKQLKKII